jgi:hypothetical protein
MRTLSSKQQADRATLATLDTHGRRQREAGPRPSVTVETDRRQLLSAIGLGMSFGLAALVARTGPAVAAAKSTASSGKHSFYSGVPPLRLSQTIVAAAREASGLLMEASTAIDDRDAVVLHDSLESAAQQLRDVGLTPADRMVLAQIKLVQRDALKRSGKSDRRLWSALRSDIEQYLSGDSNIDQAWAIRTFRAADTAAQHGDRKEAAKQLKALFSVVARRFDVFPLNRPYEDITVALKTIQFSNPRWEGAKASTRSATADLYWLVQGRAVPVLQGYYGAVEARDAFADNHVDSRRLLRGAAKALHRVEPSLAAKAKTLSTKSGLKLAEIANFADAMKKAVDQAQRTAAGTYSGHANWFTAAGDGGASDDYAE